MPSARATTVDAELIRDLARGQEGVGQAGGIGRAEQRNRDRREALGRQELWLAAEERRAGRRDEEERAMDLPGDRSERGDQRRASPVEVLDDEDRAASAGVGIEEAAPGAGERGGDDPRIGALDGVAGDGDAG